MRAFVSEWNGYGIKKIEAYLSINADLQFIGEIHSIIYFYREIADFIQSKQTGSEAENSVMLAVKT